MTTLTEPSNRTGIATIVLVLLVLLILAMMGFASFFQSSGTGRTYSRVVDIRQTIEAGESAIFEAASCLRESMDKSQPIKGGTGDNWRELICQAVQNRDPSGINKDRRIPPTLTRDVFRSEVPSLRINDVIVNLVGQHFPTYPPLEGQPMYPCGVIEMSVTVFGAQRILQVAKTIRQRRFFYLNAKPGELSCASAIFFLLPESLGTVIE